MRTRVWSTSRFLFFEVGYLFFCLKNLKTAEPVIHTVKIYRRPGGVALVLNKKNATCAYNQNSPLYPVLHTGSAEHINLDSSLQV